MDSLHLISSSSIPSPRPQARSLQSLSLSCYRNITADLAAHQGAKEARASLLSDLQRLESHLVGKNTDLMTNLCYEPLREAKEALKMEVRVIWLLSLTWWSSR